MNISLTNLYSFINGYNNAKDKDRAFTFIEFIKEFGFDNSVDIALSTYRDYLTQWALIKKRTDKLDDKEYVRETLTDTLKSLVLTYSSYEEQDFLAHLDWENELHVKAMIPFFAEKINSICEFYKNKRNDVAIIVHKNKFKGSKKSIEEIIYDKIINFYFNNKNQVAQIAELQKNLMISIEEYVDIYSEYFDIPRNRECTDESRKEMLEANLNNVDYKDYLEVNTVISDLIYSGDIYLKEIPLIAQVGLDLSAECAGDLETLRQDLLNNATLNQISLSEQVAIKRRLYEKLLGCNLYYIYSDMDKNLTQDILVTAENPTGNLLNCGSADMALYESQQIELISHIGLFFKPDKLGILKINTDDFTWSIDSEKIQPDTFYIFPDPAQYGDIGNNKDAGYPLVFEYKLDSVIKNISSGIAKDDPLGYISCTSWNTYYTKQDNDYKLNDNKEYTYSFTSLANLGYITNYQQDMFGNEYGLFKGMIIDNESNTITIPSKSSFPKVEYIDGRSDEEINAAGNNILINGGYFVDPRYPSTSEKLGRQFQYDEHIAIANDYIWTGFTLKPQTFFTPDELVKHIEASSFTDSALIKYIDHYKDKPTILSEEESSNESVTNQLFKDFITDISDEYTIIEKDYSIKDIQEMPGLLYLKDNTTKQNPILIGENVKDFIIVGDTLIIIFDNLFRIYKYSYSIDHTVYSLINEGIEFDSSDTIKILYNEKDNIFLILCLSPITLEESPNRYFYNVKILKYDPETNKLDFNYVNYTPQYNDESGTIINDNFEYIDSSSSIEGCSFIYNNNLNLYLISYLLNDNSNNPYIYNHTFRLFDQNLFESSLKSVVYTNLIGNKIYGSNSTIDTPGVFKSSNNVPVYNNLTFFIKANG